MTEREKMEQGLLYDAGYDQGLVEARTRCKALCFSYNQLDPSLVSEQDKIIRQLFGKTGKQFSVTAPFWCDYGCNIEIGENFYTNHNCIILDGAKVTFGDNVFIAPNCTFSTAGHPLDVEQRNLGLEYAYPITVGDNVWIGAGSLVNRDIPEGVIAVGNPCRVLRKITEEDKKKYWRKKL